jgi:transposase InsO family protein
MSGTGRCYDNARMESFFATLKKEKLYRLNTHQLSKDQVTSIIHRYIHYYNLRRIYSTNNGLPPQQKRDEYYNVSQVA